MRQPTTGRDFQRGRRSPSPPRRAAIAAGFGLLLLLVVLGPLMSFTDVRYTGDGNPFRQGAYAATALIVVYGLRPFQDPSRLLAISRPVVIALAICWLSLLWAIEPGIAARRLVLTTVVIWTVFASAEHLGYDATIRLVRIVLALAIVANFITVLVWPEIGIHQFTEADDPNIVGDWRGIMVHKNFAGALCAVTILFYSFSARSVPTAIRWTVIAASAVFLWFTQSKTAAGMMLAALLFGFLYLRYTARYRAALMLVVGLAVTVATAYLNYYDEPVMRLATHPDAFTGRGMIWSALGSYSEDHPLLGSGYGSFWNIGPSAPIHQYAHSWVETVTAGHNGFLDLLVEVGGPGFLVIFACLVIWPLIKLFSNDYSAGQRGGLLSAILIFCLGHNLTESSLLERDNLLELVVMLTIAFIWKLAPHMRRVADTRSVELFANA